MCDIKNEYMLEVEDLKTYFPVRKGLLRRSVGFLKAVDGVSFDIAPGKTLGLVGESGCGKTTVARSIIRLVPVTQGRVFFNGADILSANKQKLREHRKRIGFVFQNPFGSLNPRMTVGDIIAEPLRTHKGISRNELVERIVVLLSKVGLSADCMKRYPHEFSGGQRQRIGIARALVLEPKLVICDEPISSLDVSIQSQILNLLKDLQQEFGLTFLFIAHDLSAVKFFCDTVAVMYMGRIVEWASSQELYRHPLHPFTQLLFSAMPQAKPLKLWLKRGLLGKPRSSLNAPYGCAFGPRCPLADGGCLKEMPLLRQIGDSMGHFVACWKC